jgi:sodium-dependent dicarboxylate transporter 2/3/5
MLPIGIAIISKEEANGAPDDSEDRFGLALMLSIAYAASVGGTMTLIGTPPNMVFVGVLNQMYPEAPEISFVRWMMIGVPLALVFLPIIWFYITRYFKVSGSYEGSREVIRDQLRALGPMTVAEKRVLVVFIVTAIGWVFRRDIPLPFGTIPGWSTIFGISEYVHDSTVAMFSALLLFLIPTGAPKDPQTGQRPRLLDWKSAESVPWGIIWIVAGGYALAMSFKETGLADWIGQEISWLAALPVFLVVLSVVFLLIFLTEINSNTATANIFLPILAAMSIAAGAHPFLLMIPATIACSCAFMLPSGTGTNAVVFGSGRVTIPEMAACGFWLNLIGVIVVTTVMYLIAIPVFGMTTAVPLWAQ